MNKVAISFFHTIKRLNHCSHMYCFKYVFSSFMGLERFSVITGNTEPSDFIKNILIYVLKMNESHTGVEQNEGE